MSDKAYLDVIREVGMEYEPPITVRPWSDAPNCIEVCAVGETAEDHWGKLSLVMNKEMALKLGGALIAAAKESE